MENIQIVPELAVFVLSMSAFIGNHKSHAQDIPFENTPNKLQQMTVLVR